MIRLRLFDAFAQPLKFSYGRKPKGDKLVAVMLSKAIYNGFNNLDLLAYLEKLI